MNSLFPSIGAVLSRLSPRAAVIVGIFYTAGVASVEVFAPAVIRVSLLYVFGVALVAYRAGKTAGIALALLASTIIAFTDLAGREPGMIFTLLIRFLVLVAVGWLLAEAVSHGAEMAALAEERSALWKAEAEKHKATTTSLSEALDTFEQVVSNINEALWLTDLAKQKMIFVSPGYERLWGRKCAELYNDPMAWTASVHPEDRDRVRQQALTEQQLGGFDTQYRIIRADGAVRWVHDRAFPVRNQKGEVYRIVGLAQDITERKRAEEALRESENRYRTLAESSLDAIFIVGLDGRIQYLNSAAARGFNRPVTELIGKTQAELFPPEIAQRHAEGLQHMFETGATILREEQLPLSAGQRWLETRLVPLRDPSGALVAVMGMARDITERKGSEFLLQAQRDLAVSLSRTSDLSSALKRLLEIAVQMEGLDCGGVYLLDPDTGAVDLTTHLGLGKEFVNTVSHFGPDARETQIVRAGKPVYTLHETLRKTPDMEQLRALAVLPLMHEGKVLGALNLGSHTHLEIPAGTQAVIEAIAAQASGAVARLRAEEALQHSEARLRAIITGAPLIVLAADAEGRVIFEDGQALKAFGSAPGSDVGRNLTDVFHGMPALLEDIRRVLSGEEFSSIVQIDSQMFDCWFSPTRNKEGKVESVIGVATNVTERQRLQRQILEISDREQARMGQDLHDGLCQQLVSLAFDANSLEARLSSANHPESVTAKRIADLLDEAITQSRQLSRGLFPIRLEAEGLTSALEELARSTQERFGVRCHFRSAQPVLMADNIMATHLYRIAQEAVTNAVKHARPKRITISVQADAQHLELRIADDGVGLSLDEQRKSTGMGLHIMRYRAQSIGGALRLTANPTRGTTVSCRVAQPAPRDFTMGK